MRTWTLLLVALVGCTWNDEPPVDDRSQAIAAVVAHSCADRCGMPLTPVQDGWCECSDTCGAKGTCCADLPTECPAEASKATPDLAQFQAVWPKSSYVASYSGPRLATTRDQLVPIGLPTSAGIAAVSMVRFGDISDGSEWAQCQVAGSLGFATPPLFQSYAHLDWCDGCNDDHDAKCGAIGLRFPQGAPQPYVRSPGEDAYNNFFDTDGPGYDYLATPAGSTSLPFITYMRAKDGEATNEWVECQIVPSGNGWIARGHDGGALDNNDKDAEVTCGVQQLIWPSTVALALDPTVYHVDVDGYGSPGPAEQAMTTLGDSVCFLTKVAIHGGNTEEELPGCEIKPKEDRWLLKAHAYSKKGDNEKDNRAICDARCIRFTDAARWPPPLGGRARAGATSCPRKEQVGSGTATCLFRGGEATLVQNGAYDRALVVIEGFDGSNLSGPVHYERIFGDLFRHLAGAWGTDIWFVNPNGALSVNGSAQEVAEAIQFAWDFQGYKNLPDARMVVVGLSQGGLSGRIALTAWELGDYTGVVPGIASSTPPVDLLVSVGGPQEGATVPQVVLGALDAIRRNLDADLASSPIMAMLDSAPAVQLLEQDVACYDNWITDGCTALDLDIIKNGNPLDVWATEPARQICFGGSCWWTDGCQVSTSTHDTFYTGTNTRGPRGNGFPVGIPTIAFVNAGFAAQRCASFAPENLCWTGSAADPAFSTSTTVATFRFRKRSTSGFCERDTLIRAFMNPGDLRPGDLNEITNVSDLMKDATSLPREVEEMWVRDDQAFLRTPTTSALYCPGVANDEGDGTTSGTACRESNRQYGRFVDVFPRPDNKNGRHGGLHDVQKAQLLAYYYEYALGNADGVFDSCANPYGADVQCGSPRVAICQPTTELRNGRDDDCDAAVDEGPAPCMINPTTGDPIEFGVEVLDGQDNDCDGLIDEGIEVCDGVDNTGDGRIDEGTAGYYSVVDQDWICTATGRQANNAWAVGAPPIADQKTPNNDAGVRFADVNGDGRRDILQSWRGTLEGVPGYSDVGGAWVNTGSGFVRDDRLAPPEYFAYQERVAWDAGLRVAYLDADARADLILSYADDIVGEQRRAWINTGTGWQPSDAWAAGIPHFVDKTFEANRYDTGTRLADVNGDGRTDILQGYRGFIHGSPEYDTGNYSERWGAWINNGNGFTFNAALQPPTMFVYQELAGSDTGLRVVDLNADNRTDLLGAYAGYGPYGPYRQAWTCTGAGWQQNDSWAAAVPFFVDGHVAAQPDPACSTTWNGTRECWFHDTGVRFADVNTDRRTDIQQGWRGLKSDAPEFPANYTSLVGGWINTGTGFALDNRFAPPELFRYQEAPNWDMGLRLIDLDGDRRTDWLRSYRGSPNVTPDSGGACSTGQLGVCAAGTRRCVAGALECGRRVEPTAEVCDDHDNNCDGVVDSFTRGCSSACASGNQTCMAGAWSVCTASTSCGGSCFVAGTPIAMADGTTKAIETVEVGDAVVAYDTERGAAVASVVEATMIHPVPSHPIVVVNGTLRVTANHAFYRDGVWVHAGELGVGDRLLELAGPGRVVVVDRVTTLECTTEVEPVYNLEIKDQHTYFAGGILVHNALKTAAD